MVVIKKEVCYLLQKQESGGTEEAGQKERLTEQGFLVMTIIEGRQDMEKGLQDLIRNHLRDISAEDSHREKYSAGMNQLVSESDRESVSERS